MEERDSRAEGGSHLPSAPGAETASVSPRAYVPPVTRGDLYRSFGDSYTRAFELAVTPAIFGLAGYGLDRWFGILPVLTIVFSLWAVIALLLRTWYGYVARMQEHEATGPWARPQPEPRPEHV